MRNTDVITTEELQSINVSTAYEAIERLRPMFLRSRGVTSAGSEASLPVIYIDGVRSGAPDVLRTIPLADIRQIRYISAPDATTRWGTGHTGGVIEVQIRGSRP
ncbi:MAG: TonB-dependent receptor plug domain-containing protein [Gemmatimonadetes bacterium]|nr:TonB-dependent receptor plug domain-containing protein [Gemmatimonadota bacterium]